MQLTGWTVHREVMRVAAVSVEAVVVAEVIIQRLILLWRGCL
jgi:hypothetical protein